MCLLQILIYIVSLTPGAYEIDESIAQFTKQENFLERYADPRLLRGRLPMHINCLLNSYYWIIKFSRRSESCQLNKSKLLRAKSHPRHNCRENKSKQTFFKQPNFKTLTDKLGQHKILAKFVFKRRKKNSLPQLRRAPQNLVKMQTLAVN